MPIQMQKRRNTDRELFQQGGTIVGGVVGGIYGGPAGAIGGAQAGAGVGGSLGNIVSPDKPQPSQIGSGQGPAMARRQSALDVGMDAASVYQGASSFKAPGAEPPPQQGSGLGNVPQSSMQRRMDQQSPSQDLMRAESALASLTPEEQARYGPTIKQARYMDSQRRGQA